MSLCSAQAGRVARRQPHVFAAAAAAKLCGWEKPPDGAQWGTSSALQVFVFRAWDQCQNESGM